MNAQRLSRRGLLKIVGASAALPVVQACAPAPSTPQPVTKEVIKEVPLEVTRVVVATPAPAKARVRVTYWWWADSQPILQHVSNKLLQYQTAHPEIELKSETLPATLEAKAKLVTANVAGAGPDCAYCNDWFPQENFDGGWLLPVEDYFRRWDRRDDLVPRLVEVAHIRPGQPMLFLPFAVAVDGLHYRADHFKEAGLKPPDTFAEMYEVAKKLTKSPERYGQGYRAGDFIGMVISHYNLWKAHGIDVVKPDGTIDFDKPEAIDATAEHAQLFWDGHVDPGALTSRFPQMVAGLQSGKISMWLGQLNHSQLIIAGQQDPDLFQFAIEPKGPVARSSGLSIVGNLMLKGKAQDQAWELLTELAEPDYVESFVKILNFVPVFKSVASRPFFKEDRFFKVGIAQEPYYSFWPVWHKNWAKAMQVQGIQMWQEVLQKKVTPKQMHEEVAKTLRS